ncbi:class I SAM-dependent methyltransferase [Oscillochloris sp. ZM17-4]|uniref:class I SAM-dependent methyltransferase n=1 Tax=Oscillochloris sp. ZM17-4 TaxID=2866714 RepID=UPI001C7342C2|nr:class I SAM-dependent methyltransferase [Oscillochloris sp. ZM17-4]MBX0326745.1 class I SAM-dependent methyltransferase [Oscillochloris sp. ZM17-4]
MAAETPLFTRIAAAYVRGSLGDAAGAREAPLDSLSADQRAALITLGQSRGLRMHRFKRTPGRARVQAVLSILRGLVPSDLLDIGSGRGTFLWPLLDAMPALPVTATDTLAQRVADIQRVADGGILTLSAARADVTDLPFADGSFDVVTALEVLDRIPDTALALRSALRVARRFAIISVSSRADETSAHIHRFSAPQLAELLRAHGAARVSVEHVPGHIIAVAKVAP